MIAGWYMRWYMMYVHLCTGIMLHRSCDRATVRENYSYNNGDAGLALYESFDCKVYDNVFEYNKCELLFILTLK